MYFTLLITVFLPAIVLVAGAYVIAKLIGGLLPLMVTIVLCLGKICSLGSTQKSSISCAVIWSRSFGQNRKLMVKIHHYNINIYLYIVSNDRVSEIDFDK